MSQSPLQSATNAEELELAASAEHQSAPPGGWRNPRLGFLLLAGFASVGANAAWLSAAVVTLSLKTTIIGGQQQAANLLSVVIGIAGLVTIIGYPVVGRLSDRTLLAMGRRRPYLLLGAVLIAVGGVLTIAAESLPLLILAHVVTSIGVVCSLAAVTAMIPDLWAPDRRGPASAVIALGAPLGALVGLFLTNVVIPNITLMIALPYGVAVIASLLLAAVLRDRRLQRHERPRFGLRGFGTTFWVNPVRNRNFGLIWWSRLLLFFGVAALNAYLFLFLRDGIKIGDDRAASQGVFLATVVLVVFAVVFAPIFARISDRIGRRKPFVILSAALYAIGLGFVSFAPSFGSLLVALVVVGFGQGIYFAVDLALATRVLPDPATAGKDLGILNLASTLPNALVPALAPVLLAIGASATAPHNYSALFLAGAVASLIGALLILPVRGVR